MKKFFKGLAVFLGVLLVGVGVLYAWASVKADSLVNRSFDVSVVDVPVPFPLSEAELDQLREERSAQLASSESETDDDADADADADPDADVDADAADVVEVDPLEGVDLDALALERAIERGQHLVEARYGCTECHGANFGGGVMVDDPALGTFLGPNLTSGNGGLDESYSVADWDRIVRHGVMSDGRPSVMPAQDHQRMSDRELSDIIAYVRSLDPVDSDDTPAVQMGPLGTVLLAFGEIPLAADEIDHEQTYPSTPPEAAPTLEFGEHLAGPCVGCHREQLQGGPILGGDPDWLPAANLTALNEWSYEDFVRSMREMKRPDGSDVREPMTLMKPYAERMTDVELEALWAYISSLEELPTPE